MIWTKESIDNYVENNGGGCSFCLLDVFPFNKEELDQIDDVKDEDMEYVPMTDSEIADFILELAYKHIENNG